MKQSNNGFTLIELLVAISIIAILTSVATASWINAQQKGRDARRKSDLKAVQTALELYFQTNDRYPAASSGKIRCTGADTTTKDWGDTFICNSITYMRQLPKDPVYQTTTGYYYNSTSNTSYVLSALLENTSDPDLSGLGCSPQSGRNFCVTNP